MAMMRTIGGHSMDWAKPLMNQMTARKVISGAKGISRLHTVVAERPQRITFWGLNLSPSTPLMIWPAP